MLWWSLGSSNTKFTKQLPLLETHLAVTAEGSYKNKIPRLHGRSTVSIYGVTGGAACGTDSQKSNDTEAQRWKVCAVPRCTRRKEHMLRVSGCFWTLHRYQRNPRWRGFARTTDKRRDEWLWENVHPSHTFQVKASWWTTACAVANTAFCWSHVFHRCGNLPSLTYQNDPSLLEGYESPAGSVPPWREVWGFSQSLPRGCHLASCVCRSCHLGLRQLQREEKRREGNWEKG